MPKRFLHALIAFVGVISLCFAQAEPKAPTKAEAEKQFRNITAKVSLERLRDTYTTVSGFGSRLAGSVGEQKTLDFAEARFRSLGLENIRRETFEITVPDPEALGNLAIGSQDVTLFPLWPNLVRTSTCDVKGKLVYAGSGSMEDLKGMDLNGAIVVMEFNTSARWRNAAKLGAKAIVFLGPQETTRAESEQKFSSVPLSMPRFYLPMANAAPVLAAAYAGREARLTCDQKWVTRPTSNLLADLPGSDSAVAREKVVLFAYADAISTVPGIAPGAEQIGGVAAILEMARLWKAEPHRRPLTLVVSSSHGVALRGVREYVESRLVKNDGEALLTLTLDICSGNRALGSYARGWFFEFRDESQDRVRQIARMFRAHADVLGPIFSVPAARLVMTDAVNQGDGRTWKNNIPGKFAFDCEPITNAGMSAITLATIEDGREYVDTPLDTLDRVNLANVHRQVQTLSCVLLRILSDTTNPNEESEFKVPLSLSRPSRMTLIGGFATVTGSVVLYDPQKSFVPNVPVTDSLSAVLGRQKTMMGVRGDMIQATKGDRADFKFVGIPPLSSYAFWDQRQTRLAAFRLDPKTGEVDFAPTRGIYGSFSYPTDFDMRVSQRTSPLVVFKCVGVAVYDLVDPQDLTAIRNVRVLDATTDAEPMDYGIFAPGFDQRLSPEIEDVQVVFLKPGQAFKLLGGSGLGETRLILTNSTATNEAGSGYFAPGGPADQGRSSIAVGGMFPDVPLNTAKDISALNTQRLKRFENYRIISPEIKGLQTQADAAIKEAESAQANGDWGAAEREARAGWGFGLRAHPVIQKTANDVVNGVVFYLFLLLPFSYFLERLVFAGRTMVKQLSIVIAIFIAAFIILRLIHPAFEIVTNPSMIFVAFVMGSLSLIVISFILGKFESSMRMVKQAQSGVKEVDIRRGSVAIAAFNLGVSNMRRRKARTILTTLTLVVMTFIVLSFTSIVPELQLNEFPSENEARYSGILLRNPGLDPLQLTTVRQLQSEFAGKASVVRRAYYYGADIGDSGVLTLQRADRIAEVRAMLGLDANEVDVLRPQEALVHGRWFKPGERDSIILPSPLAETLKVDAAEVGRAKVKYAGADYTVVGIVDPAILRSAVDLDGDSFLPPDFSLSRRQQEEAGAQNQAFRSFIRLDPGVCFILPAETALGLGADLRTVAVRFPKPAQTRTALDTLMPRLRLNLYASVPMDAKDPNSALQVRQFSIFQAQKGTGLALVLVQMVIAAIFVLNTMIASVYERTREIGIFSSIGLAPNHIAMLFFAESLVYGILGAVFGYYAAQGTAKIIVMTGALPGLTLNFSSTAAVMSAGLVLGTVIASTIYPARKAAQIAAPAMNEQVFETDPDGDEWELPLPFSISEHEAAPLMQFLGEWFRAYEEYTIGDFVTSGTQLFGREPVDGKPVFCVTSTTWLAPYDLGVSQTLELVSQPSKVPGVYSLDLKLHREAGDPENWPVVNRRFLANVRRQFLTYRAMEPEMRNAFGERAKESFRLEPALV